MAHGKVIMTVESEYDYDLMVDVESYMVCVYAENETVLDYVSKNMDAKYNTFSACYREEDDSVDGCWGYDYFIFPDKEVYKAFRSHINRLIKKA